MITNGVNGHQFECGEITPRGGRCLLDRGHAGQHGHAQPPMPVVTVPVAMHELHPALFEPSPEPVVTHDPVNHPPHYTRGGIETIDVIEAWDLGFHLGNAVKYISRAGYKADELEDLRKARFYIDREIARLERGLSK